jgi:hypothetical protein
LELLRLDDPEAILAGRAAIVTRDGDHDSGRDDRESLETGHGGILLFGDKRVVTRGIDDGRVR